MVRFTAITPLITPKVPHSIQDVIILSNNNGNRMVRLLVTAVVIPEES